MLLAERDVQAVVGGGGLQFEIERAAEALAQREAPGFVDAGAERRVDHELHAAAFVEEALGDHGLLRGHGAKHRAAGDDVFDRLLGAGIVEAAFVLEPANGGADFGRVCAGKNRRVTRNERADLFAQLGDAPGEFHGARRRFAAPERNVGRRALRVLDQHGAAAHAANAPGRVAEQHDVAAQTLDGEILVDGADRGVLRARRQRCRARFRESRRRW